MNNDKMNNQEKPKQKQHIVEDQQLQIDKSSKINVGQYDLSSKFNNTLSSIYIIQPYILKQQKQEQNQDIGRQNPEQKYWKNNTFIFGILLILTQIALGFTFGYKIQIGSTINQPLPFPGFCFFPVFLCVGTSFIVMIGFGLLFAFHKKLVWSGLGFNAVIVCLTVQFYFIANHLFKFVGTNKDNGYFWHIFLSNTELTLLQCNGSANFNSVFISYFLYGNTLIGAFKSAMANCIAFSSILGKAGLLQAYIVSFFGVIFYQFNMFIMYKQGYNTELALCAFIYGGFFGLGMGLIQLCQYNKKDENDTKQHPLYTASSHSAAFSLIGCLFLISTLPLFNLDGKFKEMESSYFIFNPMNVLYSISASAIMSFATSAIINVKINIRDFINGALSGAIAMLCAFPFIIKPVFSLIIGSTAGIIQVLAQNMLQRKFARNFNIINTYSFCLFGVQGIIGAAYGEIYRAVTRGEFNNTSSPFLMGLVSAGIGLGVGLVVGLIMRLIVRLTGGEHSRGDHFNDFVYWIDKNQDTRSIFQRKVQKKEDFFPGIIPFV